MESRIKNALSAYMYFAASVRNGIRAQHPHMSFTDLGRTMGNMWARMSEAEKAPYQAMSDADKARYNAEVAAKNAAAAAPRTRGRRVHATPAPPRTRPARRQRAVPAPTRRNLSAYMHYAAVHRDRVKHENPGIPYTELGRRLGEMWRSLTEHEKAPYYAMAGRA